MAGSSSRRSAEAKKAAETLGKTIEVPTEYAEDAQAHLKSHKDGRLVMQITKKPGEKDEDAPRLDQQRRQMGQDVRRARRQQAG